MKKKAQGTRRTTTPPKRAAARKATPPRKAATARRATANGNQTLRARVATRAQPGAATRTRPPRPAQAPLTQPAPAAIQTPVVLTERLVRALDLLASIGLVKRTREAAPEYAFKHALVHDTAESTLLRGEHKRLHRLVAETLERMYADRLDDLAEQLAQHYAHAGDGAKTLEFALRAGDAAARIYAQQEALALYARALDAAARSRASTAQLVHLYTRRGRIQEVTGEYQAALATYEEMAQAARARGDRELELASLIARATAYASPTPVFDGQAAQGWLEHAFRLAHALHDRRAQARLFWIHSLLDWHLGHAARAVSHGEQSLALIEELQAAGHDLREQQAYTLHDLVYPYQAVGANDSARAASERAHALWRALDNQPMLADNLGGAARLAFMEGDFARARACALEGISISEQIGNVYGLIYNSYPLMLVLREQGELGGAMALLQPDVQQFRVGSPGNMMHITVYAWLLASCGAFERAAQAEQQVRARLEGSRLAMFRAWTLVWLARLNLVRGDLAAAAADLHAAALDPAQFETFVVLQADNTLAHVEYALASGQPNRACELADYALAKYRRTGYYALLPELLYLQATALIALRQQGKAQQTLTEARTLAEPRNMRRLLWQILASLAEMEAERGNYEQAHQLRAQARELTEFIATQLPEEFRESFLNLPHVLKLRDGSTGAKPELG